MATAKPRGLAPLDYEPWAQPLLVLSGLVLLRWNLTTQPCLLGAHCEDQAGFEIRDPPADASRILELKEYTTMSALV